MNQVGNGLVSEESYNSIKEFCSNRIKKYGLTTHNHGASMNSKEKESE